MFSYRQGNEERVTEKVLSLLAEGKDVALCSDGGYPGISDPGYRLIRACAKASIPYDVVPGASAVEVALLMSGLSTSSFTFRFPAPRPRRSPQLVCRRRRQGAYANLLRVAVPRGRDARRRA